MSRRVEILDDAWQAACAAHEDAVRNCTADDIGRAALEAAVPLVIAVELERLVEETIREPTANAVRTALWRRASELRGEA